MRATALLAATLAALTLGGAAEAQSYRDAPTYRMEYSRNGAPLRLNVRPRSWLDAGRTTAPFSSVNPASGYGQAVSYLANPPYMNMRDRFGEGTLPDPVSNGPIFGGNRSLLGPVDLLGELPN